MSDSERVQFPVVDMRAVAEAERCSLVGQALEKLAVTESIVVLLNDDPTPLCAQVEERYREQFAWQALEAGPEQFRLQITRRAPALDDGSAGGAAVWVDLLEAGRSLSHSGPQWSHESDDLDLTLLSWAKGRRIEPHVNTEVDVVWIGVEGEGIATVNGEVHMLTPGVALLISKGAERSVESRSERISPISACTVGVWGCS